MPNIKISDLPPVALPIDDANSFLEVSVFDAGVEVSRKITVEQVASAATGLDAEFLTLSLSPSLPNERVLTAGTNISFVDSGPNGTLTINASGVSFPLLAPDGSAVAPSYSFTNDSGAGMFLNGLGELSLAADGVEILRAINGANNQVAVAQSGSSSVPDLTSIADLDTGFRFPANNETVWIGGGSRSWNFSTVKFYSQFSNGPALINTVAQNDVPTVVPDHADANTGMGSGGGDELSLIAGGVEGIRLEETAGNVFVTYFGPILVPTGSAGAASVGFDGDTDTGYYSPVADAVAITAGGIEGTRWAEASNSILITEEIDTGITASTTQTQGQQPLVSSYNEVSIVANPNDTVTAPAVSAGMQLTIVNNGGNTLQVFPASGDNIGAGVDTAITIDAGETGVFLGRDATNWDTLFNASPGGVVFPLLAPDGTAAAPSYSFAGDTDIGLFRSGTDILGLSARSTEIARVVGALGANQFIVQPSGIQNNLSAPDLGFGDGDTGFLETVDDTLALGVGGLQAWRYEPVAASGVVQTNSNNVGLTASVTQTQAGGLALVSSYNEVSTVATTGDALTAFDVFEGHRLYVINNGANDLQLFPAVGDDFGAGVDTAITIAAGDVGIFLGRDSINWDVLFNGNTSPVGGDVFKVGTPVDNEIGVWTGDGTIEGDPNFTWDGSIFLTTGRARVGNGTAALPAYSFGGDIDTGFFWQSADVFMASLGGIGSWVFRGTSFDANIADGPRLMFEAATATNPTLIPSLGDVDTGIGWNAADQLSLVSGGVEMLRAIEAGTSATDQIFLPRDGDAATPALAIGALDRGFYSAGTAQINGSIGGVRKIFFNSSAFTGDGVSIGVALAAGPRMLNETPTGTNPTLLPNQSDPDTGIGWNAADQLSLVAGGVEGLRVTEDTGAISVDVFGDMTVTHTAVEDDDVGVQIIHDAAGFAASTALGIDYITGALASGEEEAVALINIDANLATGGTISGLEVLAAEPANADNVIGLFVGGGVEPILQLSGSFANADTVLDNAADVTTALSTGGAGNIGIFDADNDTVTVGLSTQFNAIEFILDTPASGAGIQPLFEFSTGVGTWAAFTPTDGTDQMRQSGVIAWLLADIPSWATGTGGEFLIRITRQRNTLTTTPIADLVQILDANQYGWDENADLTINSVAIQDSTQADSITISNDGTDVNAVTVGITDINIGGTGGERLRLGEFNLAMLEKAAAPGDEAGVGQFWVRNDTPNVPMFTDDAGTDYVLNASGGISFEEYQFFADQMDNPVTSDWTVNALAPAAADSNNNGLTVRLFDDTTEEGIGFILEVPSGATNIIFNFVSRAETAPGAARTVGLNIYNRGIPNNAAVQAWSSATQLTDIDIPTNEFFQEDSQTVSLATLGVTAGETTQFELTRVNPTGGTELVGDWDLLLLKIGFS
jgi:hypothetical protein